MATYTGTPRTWSAGETVTAALMNSDVRDPLAALAGAWNSYTPDLGGFTPGNGTFVGAYIRVGRLVVFRASFTFGSSSAAASATPSLSLPVAFNVAANSPSIQGLFVDATGGNYFAPVYLGSSNRAYAYLLGTSGSMGTCSTSTPFTWTTSDRIEIAGVYEC